MERQLHAADSQLLMMQWPRHSRMRGSQNSSLEKSKMYRLMLCLHCILLSK